MIFIIGGIAYILPAIVYLIFGSGETQTWNERPKDKQQSIQSTILTAKIADVKTEVDKRQLSTNM